MEMELRHSPLPEKKVSPRVTAEEAGAILKEEKAKDKAERSRFEVPEAGSRLYEVREGFELAPDSLPLHNTFIELDQDPGRVSIKALAAEHNLQSVEDYLAQGRGEREIASARELHLAKTERHEQQLARGAEIRRQRELAEKTLSVLGRLGTVFQLGRDKARELGQHIDHFSARISETLEKSQALFSTAQTKFFESLKPAVTATPEQQQRLQRAQEIHDLLDHQEHRAA